MVSSKGETSTQNPEIGLVPKSKYSEMVDINSIQPSPENNIYRPVVPDDPQVVSLSEDIRENGILEAIVVSKDGYIISGHRRHCAATLAGLDEIPVSYHDIRREDDLDAFVKLLVSFNNQRMKSFDEIVREESLSQNPTEAYYTLLQERSKTACSVEAFDIRSRKKRPKISAAKMPFLNAIIKVMDDRKKHLPLTVRQIHYALLNDPPLKHASKSYTTYQNTEKDYKSLVELVARARMEKYIPMEHIADPTRPVTIWNTFQGTRHFIHEQQNSFLNNYCRDLMQSQPDHIEILAEKNTIQPFVNRVAMEYCMPTISARGYCSVSPRYELAQRYFNSGKNRLIVLIASDFDPDGEGIAQSFAGSMRDEFGIKNIHPIKVALTHDQVIDFELIPDAQAKKSSAQYAKFVEKYGTNDVFEVEALEPEHLEQILSEAIKDVIDTDLFNQEVLQERKDAAQIAAYRKAVFKTIGEYKSEE